MQNKSSSTESQNKEKECINEGMDKHDKGKDNQENKIEFNDEMVDRQEDNQSCAGGKSVEDGVHGTPKKRRKLGGEGLNQLECEELYGPEVHEMM